MVASDVVIRCGRRVTPYLIGKLTTWEPARLRGVYRQLLKPSIALEPSSRPPLLRAGPLRTARDGFPTSGSGPLNASFGETR